MIERITKYKKDLEEIKDKIKTDLEEHLKNFDYNKKSKEIEIHRISKNIDLENIYSSPGFYIILTNQKFKENECDFTFDNQTAVYRGHCYSTKRRIKSHLSNKNYNASLEKYQVHYKV